MLPGNAPTREWKIFLAVFAFLALAIVAFGAYFYSEINSGGFFGAKGATDMRSASLDEKALSTIVHLYDERAAGSESLKSDARYLVDPSR